MINRRVCSEIKDSLSFFSVVSIIGPRQVGKTTLAKQIMSESAKPTLYLDLELQSDLFKLDDAELFLTQNDLWVKGGFPSVLFAKNDDLARRWMENFISTYLNRDLLQLGLNASPKTIRNLWTMMAHLNGQLFNATTLGNSLGLSSPTVKRYVDFLEEAFLLKSLHPFSWNMPKRLVKTPKVYLTDTGILHHLSGITDLNNLSGNPLIGNSWESFVVNQIMVLKKNPIDLYFYRTHQGTEVDLVFTRGLQVVATAEIKYSNSPQLTKGNFQAFEDLNAPMNYVITPSSDDYLFKERIRICSLKAFVTNYLKSL